jgi:hypothetical protein
VTALHFIALYGFPALARRIPRIGVGPATLRMSYSGGRGVLRHVMERCTGAGFSVAEVMIEPDGHSGRVGAVVIAEDPNVGDDLSIYPERTRLTPRPPLPPAAGGNHTGHDRYRPGCDRREARPPDQSGTSIYFRDPDGVRLELLADPLGEMYGTKVV